MVVTDMHIIALLFEPIIDTLLGQRLYEREQAYLVQIERYTGH